MLGREIVSAPFEVCFNWRSDLKRHATILIFTVTAMMSFCSAYSAHAKARVFVLTGQSNMLGLGVNDELNPPYNAPQNDVNFWDNGWVDLQPGYGTDLYGAGERFGPELSFGRSIKDAYPDDEIYLVKYAVGGTALHDDWAPGTGSQYVALMDTLEAALLNLDNANIDYDIAGILWMQGESDALENQGASYAANLENFIEHTRTELGNEEMPFVLGRVLTVFEDQPGQAELVRAAQVSVAESLTNVAWIDTDGYTRNSLGGNGALIDDQGHYGTQGQIDLGNDFASAYQSLVPEPGSLTVLGLGSLLALRRRRQ